MFTIFGLQWILQGITSSGSFKAGEEEKSRENGSSLLVLLHDAGASAESIENLVLIMEISDLRDCGTLGSSKWPFRLQLGLKMELESVLKT